MPRVAWLLNVRVKVQTCFLQDTKDYQVPSTNLLKTDDVRGLGLSGLKDLALTK